MSCSRRLWLSRQSHSGWDEIVYVNGQLEALEKHHIVFYRIDTRSNCFTQDNIQPQIMIHRLTDPNDVLSDHVTHRSSVCTSLMVGVFTHSEFEAAPHTLLLRLRSSNASAYYAC